MDGVIIKDPKYIPTKWFWGLGMLAVSIVGLSARLTWKASSTIALVETNTRRIEELEKNQKPLSDELKAALNAAVLDLKQSFESRQDRQAAAIKELRGISLDTREMVYKTDSKVEFLRGQSSRKKSLEN